MGTTIDTVSSRELIENNLDKVLADYIDATLCDFFCKLPRKGRWEDAGSDKPVEISKEFLCKLDESTFNKEFLKINTLESKEKYCIEQFKRSIISLVVIHMYDNYFTKKKTEQGVGRGEATSGDLSTFLWSFTKRLSLDFDFSKDGSEAFLHEDDFELQLSWLRMHWLHVYYLARLGVLEPTVERMEKVDSLFGTIHSRTVDTVRDYLEQGYRNVESSTGKKKDGTLTVNSDWLISWLAVNVLLSKDLNEFHQLKPEEIIEIDKDRYESYNPQQNKKVELNPSSKMRYLKHLSHHILYVLHCIRYRFMEREEQEILQLDYLKIIKTARGVKKEAKADLSDRDQYYKRPPFAVIPPDPTESLTEAQLYIMSEYSYREIGVHRELRIFERLIRQLTAELNLYSTSAVYRDHLYHVLDVCLLGELLLRSLVQKKLTLIGDSYKFFGTTIDDSQFDHLLQNWYIAALCHDLGYTVEKSGKFIKPVKDFRSAGLIEFSDELEAGFKQGRKKVHATYQNINPTERHLISDEPIEKLIGDESLSVDHGAAAWLELRHWMTETGLLSKKDIDLTPALTAILRHNLSNQNIRISKEPLSFLLILCDHLQEWGRPRVGTGQMARGIMEGFRFSEAPQFERKTRMSKIEIKGLNPIHVSSGAIPRNCTHCIRFNSNNSICKKKCRRSQMVIANKRKGITFTLPHTEARSADFEPCISWLMFCRDLQSINFDAKSNKLPITIVLKHPPSRIWNQLSWNPLEMDIFHEYAEIHEDATYLCQWIDYARKGKKGIEYQGNRNNQAASGDDELKPGEESFTIWMHKLDKPLERDLTPHHWEPFFEWKWDWIKRNYTALTLGTLIPKK